MRRAVLTCALLAASAATGAQPAAGPQGLTEARGRVAAGDFDGAMPLLERHLAGAPEDAEARFLLARVHAWAGRPARALPIYRELLAAQPRNADYLLGYGQALLWSGDAHAAIPVLKQARALAPGYREIDDALARAVAGASGPPESSGPRAAAQIHAGNPVAATATTQRERLSLTVSARYERLDRGLAAWTGQRVEFASLTPGRPGMYGALTSERRFGLRDVGMELGAVIPLRAGWSLQPEIGRVADVEFLPARYVDMRLHRDFGGGWLGSASWRRSEYREVDVQRVALGAEHYAGAWRMAYALSVTVLAGRHSAGHDLRVARGYGERSEAGLQLSAGREAALLGPRVLASDVRGIALFGRHAVGDWALLWNLGRVAQGDLYTREGLSLGLERRF